MKKYLKTSFLSLMIMSFCAGCGGNDNSSSYNSLSESLPSTMSSVSSSTSSVSSSNNSNDISESVSNEKYGELIIEDMVVFTDFPDVPQPIFTNPEYASEIEYTIIDEDPAITYEDGYFKATDFANIKVEAKTQYHTTKFKVTSRVYSDLKGEAQTKWYLNRVASVEKRWIDDGRPEVDTLFVGDSFFDTEFWSDFYTLLDGSYYTHGVSSSTTLDWEIFDKRLIYPVAPKNIVMHLGTNNLYDDFETSSKAYENTVDLLEEIHERLPETKVYYFAIEPRSYAIGGGTFSKNSYTKINEVNESMKAYCDENDYMVFVDATSYCYLEGIEVNESFFRDGCHPKLENYMVYVQLLKEAGLELKLNESNSDTTSFDIANTSSIANTNNSIKHNGKVINKEYSVSGKLKITSSGTNSHIQFSLDSTNFQNRFLLWDNDTDGSFIPGYALSGNHVPMAGDAVINKDQEYTWEVVTTAKHSYFYIEGELEIVFLNVKANEFMIGAENTGVSFYDISTITKSDDESSYNEVLSRSEINQYEEITETTKKVVIA